MSEIPFFVPMEKTKALLVLEDGASFEGSAAGAVGTAFGEIAFNTGMTGYQEIFTDPSYFGQILLMTPSHIGNYGVHDEEVESDGLKISGLVCKKFSDIFSRPSGSSSLGDLFEKQGMVGISDVDTRAIVRHIRDKGAMNAIISSEDHSVDSLLARLKEVPSMEGLELSSKVCTKEAYNFGDENAELRIAVMDYGVKRNILRCLSDRGAFLKVFPMDASLEEIRSWKPDGIMLSNGPGDPAAMSAQVTEVKSFVESGIPVFGICLGHQILSQALGLKTYKMHNGHRGVNHPVQNLLTGRCEVTSQNHGFVVDMEAVKNNADVELTHVHLNDNTVAGIRLKGKPVFSVQYHPESSAGPNDSRYLFDEFITNVRNNKV